MDVQKHWNRIYLEKAPEAVSWYTPHLEASLAFIRQAAAERSSAIIDVGGGESTLVDDLISLGFENITVLDVSQTAIDVNKRRLGQAATGVCWLAADITRTELKPSAYDLWHDRAVFHFLTEAGDRSAYLQQVTRAVKPGGHVIVATFGSEGPTKCSGLDVVRYDVESLRTQLGDHFRLVDSLTSMHRTPEGKMQQFLYCHFRVEQDHQSSRLDQTPEDPPGTD